MNGKINNILIPNVSKLPKHQSVDLRDKLNEKPDEFKNLLRDKIGQVKNEHGIQLSLHAAKRLKERDISMDGDEFFKLKNAMMKLKEKGGKDSLVITGNNAYIVDVDKNIIVTAMDKNNMSENVFTKIDSTLVIN